MLHSFLSSLWRGTLCTHCSKLNVFPFVGLLTGFLLGGLLLGGMPFGSHVAALAAPAAAPASQKPATPPVLTVPSAQVMPNTQAAPAVQPPQTPSVVLDALNQGMPSQSGEREQNNSPAPDPDSRQRNNAGTAPPKTPQELPGDPSFNTSPAPPSSLILKVTPHLQWFLDSKGALSLGNIISSRSSDFADSDPRWIEKAGTLWFRFSTTALLKSSPDLTSAPLLLDLNMRVPGQFPGIPHVWIVSGSESDGVSVQPTRTGIYRMPYPLPANSSVYIRINGLPGPGFAPMLRSPDSFDILDDAGVSALMALLALALLISLIRGILERREWRMWGALYIGAVLVETLWGMPATPADMVSLWDLPGLLAPGIALLLLPHVGRTLMRTREYSPFIDTQLILLAMPGVLLSVGPLLPGYAWTVRFIPLWPLCTLLLLPTNLSACLRGFPGARRFCFISVLPALGVIPMLSVPHFEGIEKLLPPAAPGIIPLATLALSALIIALASSPKQQFRKAPAGRNPQDTAKDGKTQKKSLLGLNTLELPPPAPKRDTRLQMALDVDVPIVSLDTPLIQEPPFSPSASPVSPYPQKPVPGILPQSLQEAFPIGIVEEALRTPLDILLREISLLDQLPLTVEGRRRSESLSRAGRHLSMLIGDLPDALGARPKNQKSREIFNLNQLLREAHDTISELAERKNLALSWFTAPHMLRSYEGPREKLSEVLKMLAESAVLATENGVVQIRAQRLQESTDPGHLLFTISDTGKGTPPYSRSSLAVIKAWELAATAEGSVSLESTSSGTAISFSMRLTPRFSEQNTLEKEAPSTELLTRLPASALRIIIASSIPANRQMLAYYLDELPHEILETRNIEEALQLYYRSPGALLIFDDDISEEDIATSVASIRAFEGEHSFPLASILALVHDDGRAERLRHAGCTHILKHPVVRTELRHLTLRLAPVPRRYRNSFTDSLLQAEKPSSTAPATPVVPATNTASVRSIPGGTPSLAGSSLAPANPAGTSPDGTPPAGSPLTMQPSTSAKAPGRFASFFSFGKRSSKNTPDPSLEKVDEPELITPIAPAAQPKRSNVSDPVPVPKTQPTSLSRVASPTPESFVSRERSESSARASLPEPNPNLPFVLEDALAGDPKSLDMPRAKPIARTESLFSGRTAHEIALSDPLPDVDEWVGEPMPVTKKKDAERENVPSPQKTSSPSFPFTAPSDAPEWVGDPIPILTKKTEPENTPREATTDAASDLYDDALFPELPSISNSNTARKNMFTCAPRSVLETHEATYSQTPEPDVRAPEPASLLLAPKTPLPDLFTLSEVEEQDASVIMLTDRIAPSSEPLEMPHPCTYAEPAETPPPPARLPDVYQPSEILPVQETPSDISSGSASESISDQEIFHMLRALDIALEKAQQGQQIGSTAMILEAATSIGTLAQAYALRTLDDPAQCLELAAQAGDMDEVNQLMSDLVVAIERNKSAFEMN